MSGSPGSLAREHHPAPRTNDERVADLRAGAGEMSEGPQDVVLAPLRAEDSPRLYGWINDRALVLLNGPYRPVTEVQHRAWFESVQQRRDVVIFGIRLAPSDRLIGSCQLLGISDVHRSAELQIRVGEADARGRGYGSEAVRQLVTFAFRDLNLERVYLHVIATNARAVRVYEKAGFVREGVLRRAAHIDGAYHDLIVMGVLRDEFAGSDGGGHSPA